MTCRTSSINWLDCLYNAVRKTPGGVIEAAKWLTDRRGKSMHPETLRSKLNGTEGESVTIEIAELLTEWMQEKAGGSEYALEWMQALAGRFGMAVDVVPPAPEGGWPDEMGAVQIKMLEITSRVGRLASTTMDAIADAQINIGEGELMIAEIRALRTMANRMERNVARAMAKGRAQR
ncbi:phage regulatory CII family protein [Stenotrophomonas rhizophila]